jgi:hypothetical protein
LIRKRAQLSKRREAQQAKVDALDKELEAVEQEILFLEGLDPSNAATQPAVESPRKEVGDLVLLSGAVIRQMAVPLLLQEHGTAPIHYRAWLELLERHGFGVMGKRPDAVFLNQVSRSPLVRSTTKAGYYQLDPAAVDRLREKLRDQQSELATSLAKTPVDVAGLELQRDHQRELHTAIARTERELDEALKATQEWQGGANGADEAEDEPAIEVRAVNARSAEPEARRARAA